MKKVTIDEKDMKDLMERNISNLEDLVDCINDNGLIDDFEIRKDYVMKIGVIKEQCDKIINMVNEYEKKE